MAKIYNIKTHHNNKDNSYYGFDSSQSETEYTPTYIGVLKILRKAFDLADMPFLAKKKNDTV